MNNTDRIYFLSKTPNINDYKLLELTKGSPAKFKININTGIIDGDTLLLDDEYISVDGTAVKENKIKLLGIVAPSKNKSVNRSGSTINLGKIAVKSAQDFIKKYAVNGVCEVYIFSDQIIDTSGVSSPILRTDENGYSEAFIYPVKAGIVDQITDRLPTKDEIINIVRKSINSYQISSGVGLLYRENTNRNIDNPSVYNDLVKLQREVVSKKIRIWLGTKKNKPFENLFSSKTQKYYEAEFNYGKTPKESNRFTIGYMNKALRIARLKEMERYARENDRNTEGRLLSTGIEKKYERAMLSGESLVKIGSMWLGTDKPEDEILAGESTTVKINVASQSNLERIPALRTVSPAISGRINQNNSVVLSITFGTNNAVNKELRHIMAMFRVSPILPIKNIDIASMLQPLEKYIHTYIKHTDNKITLKDTYTREEKLEAYASTPVYVALNGFSISMSSDVPGAVQADFLLTKSGIVSEFNDVPLYLRTDEAVRKQIRYEKRLRELALLGSSESEAKSLSRMLGFNVSNNLVKKLNNITTPEPGSHGKTIGFPSKRYSALNSILPSLKILLYEDVAVPVIEYHDARFNSYNIRAVNTYKTSGQGFANSIAAVSQLSRIDESDTSIIKHKHKRTDNNDEYFTIIAGTKADDNFGLSTPWEDINVSEWFGKLKTKADSQGNGTLKDKYAKLESYYLDNVGNNFRFGVNGFQSKAVTQVKANTDFGFPYMIYRNNRYGSGGRNNTVDTSHLESIARKTGASIINAGAFFGTLNDNTSPDNDLHIYPIWSDAFNSNRDNNYTMKAAREELTNIVTYKDKTYVATLINYSVTYKHTLCWMMYIDIDNSIKETVNPRAKNFLTSIKTRTKPLNNNELQQLGKIAVANNLDIRHLFLFTPDNQNVMGDKKRFIDLNTEAYNMEEMFINMMHLKQNGVQVYDPYETNNTERITNPLKAEDMTKNISESEPFKRYYTSLLEEKEADSYNVKDVYGDDNFKLFDKTKDDFIINYTKPRQLLPEIMPSTVDKLLPIVNTVDRSDTSGREKLAGSIISWLNKNNKTHMALIDQNKVKIPLTVVGELYIGYLNAALSVLRPELKKSYIRDLKKIKAKGSAKVLLDVITSDSSLELIKEANEAFINTYKNNKPILNNILNELEPDAKKIADEIIALLKSMRGIVYDELIINRINTESSSSTTTSTSDASLAEASSVMRPVKEPYGITSSTGSRKYRSNGKIYEGFHSGIDYICTSANSGEHDCVSIADGIVYSVYDKFDWNTRNESHNTGGNYVIIKYNFKGTIYYGFYFHLKKNIRVKAGDSVSKGDLIGTYSKTGSDAVTGNHVHFELRKDVTKVWKGFKDFWVSLLKESNIETTGENAGSSNNVSPDAPPASLSMISNQLRTSSVSETSPHWKLALSIRDNASNIHQFMMQSLLTNAYDLKRIEVGKNIQDGYINTDDYGNYRGTVIESIHIKGDSSTTAQINMEGQPDPIHQYTGGSDANVSVTMKSNDLTFLWDFVESNIPVSKLDMLYSLAFMSRTTRIKEKSARTYGISDEDTRELNIRRIKKRKAFIDTLRLGTQKKLDGFEEPIRIKNSFLNAFGYHTFFIQGISIESIDSAEYGFNVTIDLQWALKNVRSTESLKGISDTFDPLTLASLVSLISNAEFGANKGQRDKLLSKMRISNGVKIVNSAMSLISGDLLNLYSIAKISDMLEKIKLIRNIAKASNNDATSRELRNNIEIFKSRITSLSNERDAIKYKRAVKDASESLITLLNSVPSDQELTSTGWDFGTINRVTNSATDSLLVQIGGQVLAGVFLGKILKPAKGSLLKNTLNNVAKIGVTNTAFYAIGGAIDYIAGDTVTREQRAGMDVLINVTFPEFVYQTGPEFIEWLINLSTMSSETRAKNLRSIIKSADRLLSLDKLAADGSHTVVTSNDSFSVYRTKAPSNVSEESVDDRTPVGLGIGMNINFRRTKWIQGDDDVKDWHEGKFGVMELNETIEGNELKGKWEDWININKQLLIQSIEDPSKINDKFKKIGSHVVIDSTNTGSKTRNITGTLKKLINARIKISALSAVQGAVSNLMAKGYTGFKDMMYIFKWKTGYDKSYQNPGREAVKNSDLLTEGCSSFLQLPVLFTTVLRYMAESYTSSVNGTVNPTLRVSLLSPYTQTNDIIKEYVNTAETITDDYKTHGVSKPYISYTPVKEGSLQQGTKTKRIMYRDIIGANSITIDSIEFLNWITGSRMTELIQYRISKKNTLSKVYAYYAMNYKAARSIVDYAVTSMSGSESAATVSLMASFTDIGNVSGITPKKVVAEFAAKYARKWGDMVLFRWRPKGYRAWEAVDNDKFSWFGPRLIKYMVGSDSTVNDYMLAGVQCAILFAPNYSFLETLGRIVYDKIKRIIIETIVEGGAFAIGGKFGIILRVLYYVGVAIYDYLSAKVKEMSMNISALRTGMLLLYRYASSITETDLVTIAVYANREIGKYHNVDVVPISPRSLIRHFEINKVSNGDEFDFAYTDLPLPIMEIDGVRIPCAPDFYYSKKSFRSDTQMNSMKNALELVSSYSPYPNFNDFSDEQLNARFKQGTENFKNVIRNSENTALEYIRSSMKLLGINDSKIKKLTETGSSFNTVQTTELDL